MSTRTHLLAWARALVALLGFSALVTEVATLAARGVLVPANFFSYFTVESNLFAAAVMLASALHPGSHRVDLLRGASTVFMLVVFCVFAVLLAGLDVPLTAVPWDNVVLHYLVPLAVALDWWVVPPQRRIAFRSGLVWLTFPVLFVVYSLVRGPIVGWYPYPFLDPAHGGYAAVAVTCLGIAAGGVALTWVVTRTSSARARKTPAGG